MTPTEQDLARQLAAHRRMTWMLGMRAIADGQGWRVTNGTGFADGITLTGDDFVNAGEMWSDLGAVDMVPDLDDAATQGCLWAMLRESAPAVHVYDESFGYVIECHPGGDRERHTARGIGAALARALLAAWGEAGDG